MKYKLWKHQGKIAKKKIIKKTGCDRVLVEALTPKNIYARDLIAFQPYEEEKITVCKAWELYRYLNMKYIFISPIPYDMKMKIKDATFRVESSIQEGLRLWVELNAIHYKSGKTHHLNEFILIWEKDNE